MLFSLDVLRARKGDCLLLHYGTKQRPRLIMIDGGPSKVYGPQLKPRLEKIRDARGLNRRAPVPVDVLMVSHVDDDHIRGILELTRDLTNAQGGNGASLVKVTDLWHNSFDDILKTTPEQLKATAGFGAASLDAHMATADRDDGEEPAVDLDTAKVLASVSQGRDLRIAAKGLRWKVNKAFDGKLIVAEAGAASRPLTGGLKITTIGPMQDELQALQKKHDDWLRKHPEAIDRVPAAFTDRSVPNLSSLVFLVEGGGRTMLLTGDARGDKVLKGLELAGLLQGGSGSLHVDLLKVPHHGSANNVALRFFKRVTADHYVFSGDGGHGNPERETLEMLLKARGSAPFTIHLTYPVAEIDRERQAEWEKQQARERKRRAKARTAAAKAKVKVREDWSAERHGLAALLERAPRVGQRLEVVAAKKGHVIDLGDRLGDAFPKLAA